MPTSSELTLAELDERAGMIRALDVLLAICASEIRFQEDLAAGARSTPFELAAERRRQLVIEEAQREAAARELADYQRKAS